MDLSTVARRIIMLCRSFVVAVVAAADYFSHYTRGLMDVAARISDNLFIIDTRF